MNEPTEQLCECLEAIKRQCLSDARDYDEDVAGMIVEGELRQRLVVLDRAARERDRIHLALAFPILQEG